MTIPLLRVGNGIGGGGAGGGVDRPASLRARALSGTAIQLDATASPTPGVDSYRFERLIGATWTEIDTVPAADVTDPLPVTGLTTGTFYQFRIIAIAGVDESAPRTANETTLSISYSASPTSGGAPPTDIQFTIATAGGTAPYSWQVYNVTTSSVVVSGSGWDGTSMVVEGNLPQGANSTKLIVDDSEIGQIESSIVVVTINAPLAFDPATGDGGNIGAWTP